MNTPDASPEGQPPPGPEWKINLGPTVGQGLGGAINAIQQLFEGIATAAKNAIGPAILRDLEAAGWLGRVAACLDGAAAALGGPPAALADKSGELACHLERLAAEVKGSKFEAQEAAFRQRLEGATAALDADPASAARVVNAAAGYFRAAASAIGPIAAPAPNPPA